MEAIQSRALVQLESIMLPITDEVTGRDHPEPKERSVDGEFTKESVSPQLRIRVIPKDFEEHKESGLPDIFPCR